MTEDQLFQLINNTNIKIGDIYYHYRSPDKHYKVLSIALDESSEKPMVVYQSLYGKNLVWTRNLDIWNQLVEHNNNPVARFSLVQNLTKIE